MLSIKKILLIFCVTFASITSLPTVCLAACEQAITTVEKSQCAKDAADKAEQKMKEVLAQTIEAAKKIIGNGNKVDLRPKIQKSQSEWEKWMQTQCDLEADVTMGSAGAYVLFECRERLIDERAKSLNNITEQLTVLSNTQ